MLDIDITRVVCDGAQDRGIGQTHRPVHGPAQVGESLHVRQRLARPIKLPVRCDWPARTPW